MGTILKLLWPAIFLLASCGVNPCANGNFNTPSGCVADALAASGGGGAVQSSSPSSAATTSSRVSSSTPASNNGAASVNGPGSGFNNGFNGY